MDTNTNMITDSNTRLQVTEHIRREHTDEMRLACGMGGCDEVNSLKHLNCEHCGQVFDNRGALKRHRTDAHPELEEFKPVDLENDDPDRTQVLGSSILPAAASYSCS